MLIDKEDNQSTISLKWIFFYKHDLNGFLIKYKTRLMVRDDLQSTHIEIDDQDVYAIILTFKMFKILMILMIVFHLKMKQFDAINVFFNSDYNENVYCYMFENYNIYNKMLKNLKALYDMRLFFVL